MASSNKSLTVVTQKPTSAADLLHVRALPMFANKEGHRIPEGVFPLVTPVVIWPEENSKVSGYQDKVGRAVAWHGSPIDALKQVVDAMGSDVDLTILLRSCQDGPYTFAKGLTPVAEHASSFQRGILTSTVSWMRAVLAKKASQVRDMIMWGPAQAFLPHKDGPYGAGLLTPADLADGKRTVCHYSVGAETSVVGSVYANNYASLLSAVFRRNAYNPADSVNGDPIYYGCPSFTLYNNSCVVDTMLGLQAMVFISGVLLDAEALPHLLGLGCDVLLHIERKSGQKHPVYWATIRAWAPVGDSAPRIASTVDSVATVSRAYNLDLRLITQYANVWRTVLAFVPGAPPIPSDRTHFMFLPKTYAMREPLYRPLHNAIASAPNSIPTHGAVVVGLKDGQPFRVHLRQSALFSGPQKNGKTTLADWVLHQSTAHQIVVTNNSTDVESVQTWVPASGGQILTCSYETSLVLEEERELLPLAVAEAQSTADKIVDDWRSHRKLYSLLLKPTHEGVTWIKYWYAFLHRLVSRRSEWEMYAKTKVGLLLDDMGAIPFASDHDLGDLPASIGSTTRQWIGWMLKAGSKSGNIAPFGVLHSGSESTSAASFGALHAMWELRFHVHRPNQSATKIPLLEISNPSDNDALIADGISVVMPEGVLRRLERRE